MTQPGWYPDPSAPFMVRWWDGQVWSNEVRPAGTGPAVGFAGPDPAADLAEETKAGRTASMALWGGAVAYTGRLILNAVLVGRFWPAFRRWLDRPVGARGRFVMPRGLAGLNLASQLFSIALLAVGVMYLVWFHKAATVAVRAGLPARRSPGWAIGGWFVPIVNFWFPYQSAIDFFPPGHPGRQKVKRWWTLWLVFGFTGLIVFAASFVSTGLGIVVAVLCAALGFAAAAAGIAVIDEVDRVHAGLLGR